MTDIISERELARLVDTGLVGIHLGEVELGRSLFEHLLVYRPAHRPARIGMAFSYLVVSDFARAEEILKEQVLSEHPDDAEALAMLGLNYALQGKNEEAEAAFQRIPPHATARALQTAIAAFAN